MKRLHRAAITWLTLGLLGSVFCYAQAARAQFVSVAAGSGGGVPGGGGDEGGSFVSLSAVTGATNYRLYWGTGAPYRYYCDLGNVTSLATPADMPATCEPLVDGTWAFSVTATDDQGFQGAYATEDAGNAITGVKTACASTLSAGAAIGTAVSAATAGNIICLNDGSYSGFTLNGVTKNPRVRVRAINQSGISITSAITLTGGTSGITLDFGSPSNSLYVLNVNGAATADLTVRQFSIPHQIVVDGPTSTTPNILIENFTQTNVRIADITNGLTQGVDVENAGGARTTPIATFRNFAIDGGNSDGFQPGTAVVVEDGIIRNKAIETEADHTDAFQMCCGQGNFAGTIIRRNYFYNNTQNLTAFDGVDNVLLENNLMDPGTAGRTAQIEWYDDDSSIIRYNTILYHDSGNPGDIDINERGVGGHDTEIYDNIAGEVGVTGATVASNTHNCVRTGAAPNVVETPTYAGGSFPSTFAGALLSAGGCKGEGQSGIDTGVQFRNLPAPANFQVNP